MTLRSFSLALSFTALVGLASTGLAITSEDIEYLCTEVDTNVTFASPTDQVWKIVFVRFPQGGDASSEVYPDYASHLVSELEDYIVAMSRGVCSADVEIVLDPEDETRPWTADKPATEYAYNGGCEGSGINWVSTDTLNVEIMTKIHEAYPPEGEGPLFWENVDVVIMIQYDNATFNRCGIGGIGGPTSGLRVQSLVPGFVEGYNSSTQAYQVGTTQHLFLGDCTCSVRSEDDFANDVNPRLEAAVGHELGHSFGLSHTPNTGNGGTACVACGNPPVVNGRQTVSPFAPCQACGGAGQPSCDPIYVNVGRYSLMRGVVDGSQPFEGLTPFHPRDLTLTQNFWGTHLVDSVITTNVRNFHVPQIRSSRAKYHRVVPSGQSAQFFLLANHQGSSSSAFDAKYGGSGLLIWHMRNFVFFDPELPDGRDGNNRDRLEQNWCEYGDGEEDFGDGTTGKIHFSSTTNPTTNLLPSPFRFQVDPENVFSGVGIENIRQAGGGSAYPTDMIVDIYVNATQYVTAPNGAEVYPVGQPVSITWLKRDYASISSVDLHLSTNGGSTYATTIGTGLSNTGSYSWTPTVLSTQNRIQLTGDDPSATNGVDASDANFTVWGPSGVTHSNLVVPEDSIKVDITWDTNVSTSSSDDVVVFYTTQTGSTTIPAASVTYTTTNGGLSHKASCIFTPCDTNYHYYVAKSKYASVTLATTRTSSTRFKASACVTP